MLPRKLTGARVAGADGIVAVSWDKVLPWVVLMTALFTSLAVTLTLTVAVRVSVLLPVQIFARIGLPLLMVTTT